MKKRSEPRAASTAPVPLLDVNRGNQPFRDEILEAITRVVDSGRFLYGPDCAELEKSVAELCDVPHAVGCASGSDALLLALMALGVGSGDEVIVPSFTFFATASAVSRLGARPVFVDIDPATFNIDPRAVTKAMTPRTKAIIPVHLFGMAAAVDEICDVAVRQGVAVVEDAAQAIGARLHGRPVGGWGDVGCFSFYPTKNLGGFGDGGMLVTRNAALAERLRLLAAHGMNPRYYHSVIGINSRLDSIQAAALRVKLGHLEEMTAGRRRNAARYSQLLEQAGLSEQLVCPVETRGRFHVWNQYTVRVPHEQRDALRQYLADHQVGSEVYYPVPLHRQECFHYLGYGQGSLPETEHAAEEVLSLPIFPELGAVEQEQVIETMSGFFAARRSQAA